MGPNNLSSIQIRVLEVLAALDPPGRLAGGAAIIGFVAPHRETRDIDLFWHGRLQLDELGREARALLAAAGFEVELVRTSSTFEELIARDRDQSLLVNLVAEATPALLPPVTHQLGAASVLVEAPAELVVSKLCALLGRQEIRDLVDLKVLLESGLELAPALAEAPRKDGGFSPLTLAWLLRGVPVDRLARECGMRDDETRELSAFRDELVERLAPPPRD